MAAKNGMDTVIHPIIHITAHLQKRPEAGKETLPNQQMVQHLLHNGLYMYLLYIPDLFALFV